MLSIYQSPVQTCICHYPMSPRADGTSLLCTVLVFTPWFHGLFMNNSIFPRMVLLSTLPGEFSYQRQNATCHFFFLVIWWGSHEETKLPKA